MLIVIPAPVRAGVSDRGVQAIFAISPEAILLVSEINSSFRIDQNDAATVLPSDPSSPEYSYARGSKKWLVLKPLISTFSGWF